MVISSRGILLNGMACFGFAYEARLGRGRVGSRQRLEGYRLGEGTRPPLLSDVLERGGANGFSLVHNLSGAARKGDLKKGWDGIRCNDIRSCGF